MPRTMPRARTGPLARITGYILTMPRASERADRTMIERRLATGRGRMVPRYGFPTHES